MVSNGFSALMVLTTYGRESAMLPRRRSTGTRDEYDDADDSEPTKEQEGSSHKPVPRPKLGASSKKALFAVDDEDNPIDDR